MADVPEIPEEEILARDHDYFAGLVVKEEYAGKVIGFIPDGSGKVVVVGTWDDVHDYREATGEEIEAVAIPDFSRATEEQIKELFGITDAENYAKIGLNRLFSEE